MLKKNTIISQDLVSIFLGDEQLQDQTIEQLRQKLLDLPFESNSNQKQDHWHYSVPPYSIGGCV